MQMRKAERLNSRFGIKIHINHKKKPFVYLEYVTFWFCLATWAPLLRFFIDYLISSLVRQQNLKWTIKTNYQACQAHSIWRESPAYLFFFSNAEVKNMCFSKICVLLIERMAQTSFLSPPLTPRLKNRRKSLRTRTGTWNKEITFHGGSGASGQFLSTCTSNQNKNCHRSKRF